MEENRAYPECSEDNPKAPNELEAQQPVIQQPQFYCQPQNPSINDLPLAVQCPLPSQPQPSPQPTQMEPTTSHQIRHAVKNSIMKLGNWLVKEQLQNLQLEQKVEEELQRMSRLSNEYASWQCSPNVEKAEAEIWDGNPSERKSSMYTISKMFKKKSIDKENILPKVRSGISLKSTFGDKIYENQSATTLQKSVLSYSVPKANRFTIKKFNIASETYYTGTCFTQNGKGTSFGIGQRKNYPLWMEKNMKEYPAPNAYLAPIPYSNNSKGPSFGISYRSYEKAGIFQTEPIKQSKLLKGKIKRKQNFFVKSSYGWGQNYHYSQIKTQK